MKIIITIIALTSLTLSSIAEENLIENGDFSQGSEGWRGGINVELETPTSTNKVCKIELKTISRRYHENIENIDPERFDTYVVYERYDNARDQKTVMFYQKIKTRGLRHLILKYRFKKSKDYDSSESTRPVDFSFVGNNNKTSKHRTYNQRAVEKYYRENRDTSWKFYEYALSLDGDPSSGTLSFFVYPGYSGYVMIDDISVTGE